MDTNRGEFVDESRSEQWMKRLEVGQIVKLMEEEFEVLEIGKRTVLLKLRSFEDRALGQFAGLLQPPTKGDDAVQIESDRHRKKMLAGKG